LPAHISLIIISDNLLKLVICSNHKSDDDKFKSNPYQTMCFQIKSSTLCAKEMRLAQS